MENKDKYEHNIELPMNFHKVFVVWLLIAAVLSVPIALYIVCDTLINFDILTSAFTYNPIVTILYIIAIILTWIRIPLHIKAYTAMSEMQYYGISLFNKALVVNIAINVLTRCPWTSGIIKISGYLLGAFIAWLIYYIPINIYYKKRAYLFNPPENLKDKAYNDYIVAVEKYKTRNSPLESSKAISIGSSSLDKVKFQNSLTPHVECEKTNIKIKTDSAPISDNISNIAATNSFSQKATSNADKIYKLINNSLNTPVNDNNTTNPQSKRTAPIRHTATHNKINFCRKCGQKLVVNSLYCSNCGSKIIPEDDQNDQM